jgi:hypothetical protein
VAGGDEELRVTLRPDIRPHVAEAVARELAGERAPGSRSTVLDWDHLVLRRGVLRTPDGDVPVEKIGQGAFATVYRGRDGRVFAVVDDDVYDKEVYEYARDAARPNPHVPAVERFGFLADPPDKKVYVMPHYRAPLRKGDGAQAWADYRTLEKCWRGERSTPAPGVTPSVVEALADLVDTASNYSTEYALEIVPRNLATDAEERLVLLDVLYDREALARKRAEQRRRAEGRRR